MKRVPAIRQNAAGGQVQQGFWPPPVKGLSFRSDLLHADMGYMSDVINFYPQTQNLMLRPGVGSWATAASSTALSLHAYPTAMKMFVATQHGIFDISAGGVGTSVVAFTFSSIYPWLSVNFTNSVGTSFLWGASATTGDPPFMYNGAVWSNPAITGVTSTTTLCAPWVFKRRIFFLSESPGDELTAYYLPTDSIQGAAKKLPLGAVFSRGGRIQQGINWTLDGGNGPDDYCCFITSEGEIAVYQGTDPSSAASWSLVGVFYIGHIGTGCRVVACRVGGDVIVMSSQGLFSMTKIVSGRMLQRDSLSYALSGVWQALASTLGPDSYIALWSTFDMLILGLGGVNQYVLNLGTGAWSKFDVTATTHAMISVPLAPEGRLYCCYRNFSGTTEVGVYAFDQDMGNDITYSFTQFPGQLVRSGTAMIQLIQPRWRSPAWGSSTVVELLGKSERSSAADPTIVSGTRAPFTWRSIPMRPGQDFQYSLEITAKLPFTGSALAWNAYLGSDIQYTRGASGMP